MVLWKKNFISRLEFTSNHSSSQDSTFSLNIEAMVTDYKSIILALIFGLNLRAFLSQIYYLLNEIINIRVFLVLVEIFVTRKQNNGKILFISKISRWNQLLNLGYFSGSEFVLIRNQINFVKNDQKSEPKKLPQSQTLGCL